MERFFLKKELYALNMDFKEISSNFSGARYEFFVKPNAKSANYEKNGNCTLNVKYVIKIS